MAISAIRRDDGSLRGFAKVTYDITSQRIEEEQRAIILEAAPNGMMIVDEAGTITLANSQVEAIFGYPAGTLVGQKVEVLVPDAMRIAHDRLRSDFTSGRSSTAMAPQRQFTGRKRDGGSVLIEIMLNAIETPRGRIVVASLFDVTDRVRLAGEQHEAEESERQTVAETNTRLERLAGDLAAARDQAEEANKAKSRFLTGMTLRVADAAARHTRLRGNAEPRRWPQSNAIGTRDRHDGRRRSICSARSIPCSMWRRSRPIIWSFIRMRSN